MSFLAQTNPIPNAVNRLGNCTVSQLYTQCAHSRSTMPTFSVATLLDHQRGKCMASDSLAVRVGNTKSFSKWSTPQIGGGRDSNCGRKPLVCSHSTKCCGRASKTFPTSQGLFRNLDIPVRDVGSTSFV